jgi:hypothetical protein
MVDAVLDQTPTGQLRYKLVEIDPEQNFRDVEDAIRAIAEESTLMRPDAHGALWQAYLVCRAMGDTHSQAIGYARAGIVSGMVSSVTTGQVWAQVRASGRLTRDEARTLLDGAWR